MPADEAPATAEGLAALAGGDDALASEITQVLSGDAAGPVSLPACGDKAARAAQHQ